MSSTMIFLILSVVVCLVMSVQSQTVTSTSNGSLPLCGPPTSLEIQFSNTQGQALPLGSPTSALLNANQNITELLQTNNVVNLTLNSIPLESIAEMGLLLLSVGELTNYNISSHNQAQFSLEIFESAYNIYQNGVTAPLNDTYGFINATNSIYASNVQFFTNGNTENEAYLGTISIMSNSNVTGIECESVLYFLVLWNPPADLESSVVGDPVFKSLRGKEFQVHGHSNDILNIWASDDLIMNTRFAFLEANSEDEKQTLLTRHNGNSNYVRAHPGTYLDMIGIRSTFSDKILVVAGPMNQGFQLVQVNGLTIAPDSFVLLSSTPMVIKVDYIDRETITIRVYNEFTVYITNCDRFLNIVKLASHKTEANGLIGGTHTNHRYENSELKVVPGNIDDYVVNEGDIFGSGFVFNTFTELSKDASKPVAQYYI